MMTKEQVKACLLEVHSVEHLEKSYASHTTGTPFGKDADLWHKMKVQMLPGDSLHHFCTDAQSWLDGEGRSGIALVRDGEVVYFFSTVHT